VEAKATKQRRGSTTPERGRFILLVDGRSAYRFLTAESRAEFMARQAKLTPRMRGRMTVRDADS